MKIVVQKFGGTSVSSEEKRNKLVEKVKRAISQGYNPIVVVSAMGRKGDNYATDTLLSLIDEKFKKNNKQATDLLISCGEIISSVVVTNELVNAGIKAIPLTGGQAGIITDDVFQDATYETVDNRNLIEILNEGSVPVVTGFQGVTKKGYVTTLGRGGSDTSAAIIGSAVNADKIEIYTDVDGIMTADPRIVKNASVINVLNYDEVFQLADQGAKVIHPKSIEIAKQHNIPVYIKNTMNDTEGTIINSVGDKANKKLVTSITSCGDRMQVIIKLDENKENLNYNKTLDIIADNNISLDFINIFPEEQIFTISKEDSDKLSRLFNNLKIKYHIKDNCCKVAIVGSGMRGIPGVMAKIYRTLQENNIEVLQTADSHMTIWCLIEDKQLEKAVNALHKAFI